MNYKLRSAVGVLIGCINVLGFSATSIYIIIILCDFGKLSDDDIKRNQDVISRTVILLFIILVICIISIILSGLLLAGIIMKRHLLMTPWLICSFAGIVCHSLRIIIGFLSGFLAGTPVTEEVLTLMRFSFALGIQILLFYAIYKLYNIIRDMTSSVQYGNECEETALNTINNDNPPSYGDLERSGQLQK